MKYSKIHFIFTALPLVLAVCLFVLKFQTDTEKMLSLFLSFIWGEMFALGGGLVFLRRYNFAAQLPEVKALEQTSERVSLLGLILIIQTLMFLALAALFPARECIHSIITKIDWTSITWSRIKTLYDSLLFSLIICPSILSVLMGMWCLYLSLNERKSSPSHRDSKTA